MAEYQLRRMTKEDVEAVYALDCEAFTLPWSLSAFMSEMTSNKVARYLVAVEDGQIIGYAGAHIILDEGHITNIAVSKNRRRAGVGRSLLRALMQYASNLGAAYLTLEVRASNTAAINMYAEQGFFKVHVRKRYYEDNGEDAWLMVCDALMPAEADFAEEESVAE